MNRQENADKSSAFFICNIFLCFSGKVQKQLNQMVAHARALGVPEAIDPFMTLSFISLTVIPELRLTDNGLYDVNLGQFV